MADSVLVTKAASSKPAQANPLAKKLIRILEHKLDEDKDTVEALTVLSELMDTNTLQSRRSLRSDLEKRNLQLCQSFCELLEGVVTQVNEVQNEVGAMKECCSDMQQRLEDTKRKTSGLLKETFELKERGTQLDMKALIVEAFLNRFQLTAEEKIVLTGPNGSAIDKEFFAVLHHVQCIHEDCKLLLRSSQQRAGLEIMESMAMYLEEGYERLYHWSQAQCRSMTGDLPSSSSSLTQSLTQLKERPVLHKYCVDEYVLARRGAVVQSFIDALTRGSNGRRPIELLSHDPVRYIGDMLSWLHQTLATEKDHVSSLILGDSRFISTLLGSMTEGVCRPLKVRVEQVLLSSIDPVTSYQLVNLVRYYNSVFIDILISSAPLLITIAELAELQSKMFFSSLTVHTSKLLEGVESPGTLLTPPGKLLEVLTMLQKILTARDISVSTVDDHKDDLAKIISTCLEPMIHFCHESASILLVTDMAVFMSNCLHLIHTSLSLYEFTEPALEQLDAQMMAHMDTLVDQQASQFLQVVGLVDCYSSLQDGSLLSENQITALSNIGAQLTSFLSAPDTSLLPQLSLVSNTAVREVVKKRSVELFLRAYEQVYDAITAIDPLKATTTLPHSPLQAKTLIGLL